MSTSLLDLDPLVIPLVKGERILDVGCGFGHWGHLLMTHYRPDAEDPASRAKVTGIELHAGNADLCRQAGAYEEVIQADALVYLEEHSPSLFFDTIIAIDILEHLERDQSLKLLALIERIAQKRVIVSTPNFPNLREGGSGITGPNPWEHHLSCWSYRNFKQRGYLVRGVKHNVSGKLYRIRGVYRLMRNYPVLNEFLDLLASRRCRMAHTVLAWKDV